MNGNAGHHTLHATENAAELRQLRTDARAPYEAALRTGKLNVFLIRLAITLPLLAISAWLILRKRQSSYWPLYRGFVFFSLFAFFFHPFLPCFLLTMYLRATWVSVGRVRIVRKRYTMEERERERERESGTYL